MFAGIETIFDIEQAFSKQVVPPKLIVEGPASLP